MILGDIDIVTVVLGLHMGIVAFVVADRLKLLVAENGSIGQVAAIELHVNTLFLEHCLIFNIYLVGVRCMEGSHRFLMRRRRGDIRINSQIIGIRQQVEGIEVIAELLTISCRQ